MRTIDLKTLTGRSQIRIGQNIFDRHRAGGAEKTVVVADGALVGLYQHMLSGFDIIPIEAGEASKSLALVEKLYAAFFERELERGSRIIGLGGGAACDVAGFAAATYLRGIPFTAVPTTLLAQVDASIGGKNGVNFHGRKNLVGTIRQPEVCICDSIFLKTLPERDLACGFSEVIKHAAIESVELFEFLEKNAREAFLLNPSVIEEIVFQSVSIKARIVEIDEQENNERRTLNFGHTFGHAIEALYALPHGEAVAMGMSIAARVSQRAGMISSDIVERFEGLLRAYNLPPLMSVDKEKVLSAILYDKKRSGGVVNMVLLESIGKSRIVPMTFDELRTVLYDLR